MHSILLQHYFNALTKININCILRQNICLQEQKLEDTKNGLKRGRFLVSWNTVLTTSYSSFRNCFIKIFLWKETVFSSFYRLHTEVKELLSPEVSIFWRVGGKKSNERPRTWLQRVPGVYTLKAPELSLILSTSKQDVQQNTHVDHWIFLVVLSIKWVVL